MILKGKFQFILPYNKETSMQCARLTVSLVDLSVRDCQTSLAEFRFEEINGDFYLF